jgi:hypothetical protein
MMADHSEVENRKPVPTVNENAYLDDLEVAYVQRVAFADCKVPRLVEQADRADHSETTGDAMPNPSDELTDAKIAAAEARTDAKLGQVDVKFERMLGTVELGFQSLRTELAGMPTKGEIRSGLLTIVLTIVGVGVGLAALVAPMIIADRSNILSAFQAGGGGTVPQPPPPAQKPLAP